MGSVGETQLCWAILGFLLLQGHNSQPATTSPQGDGPSAEPNYSSPLSSTGIPGTGVPSSGKSSGSTSRDTSHNVTSKLPTMSLRTREDSTILPSPTSETVLTVAAFGVISFIAILVVVVIILVSVVSLRFKCRKNKESEDPQKPGSSGLSESCSTANGEKDSITLISMKNINMNNSKGCPSAEKVHFSWFLPPFSLLLLLSGSTSLTRKEILSKIQALLSSSLPYHSRLTSSILIMYLFCRFFKSDLGSLWI
uniref:Endothelial cell surface expressed chemotaxis and apoptosis regulator n=1 Tax=Balaenoptera musculus TaxID=9771 RepID=A0A8C0CDU9_BALMU